MIQSTVEVSICEISNIPMEGKWDLVQSTRKPNALP